MGPVVEEIEGLTLVDLPHEGEGKQEGGNEQEDVHTAGNLAHPDVVKPRQEHADPGFRGGNRGFPGKTRREGSGRFWAHEPPG